MKTINDKTFQIYVVYHDKSFLSNIKKANRDMDLYELYYTKEEIPNTYNFIQEYINEFVAQDYVLKNNIKTDYVGFCQYRRVLNIDLDDFLDNNSEATGLSRYTGCYQDFCKRRFNNFLVNDFEDYIADKYDKNSRIYRCFIKYKFKNVAHYVNELYLCKWEYFEEIVSCISGFLEYLSAKYELYSKDDWYNFILNKYIGPKLTKGLYPDDKWLLEKDCTNFFRIIANFIEIVEGFYFGHISNELNLPKTYI